MYQPTLSPRERAATVSAVTLIHVALAILMLNLAGALKVPVHGDLTQLIDVNLMPPPVVEIQPKAERLENKESTASAKNIDSQATPVIAPKPVIELPQVQPMVASPTPQEGTEATQGASDVVGPGIGAGGSGAGTGSGDAGNGDGGGGSGIASRARLMSPSLRTRDYPSALRGRLQNGAPPFVLFTVDPNGRVHNCRVYRPSGDPAVDMVTCSLVTARFVYRPAYDQRGQPVASDNGYEQRN